MVKKLSVANIEKESKVFEEKLKVKVTSQVTGAEFHYTVDRYFAKEKSLALVSEMMAQVEYAKKNDIKINSMFEPFSLFLILKHFTSIGDDAPSELNAQIAVIIKLMNLRLIEELFNSLPKDELEIVFEDINETVSKMDEQFMEAVNSVVELQQKLQEFEDAGTIEVEEDEEQE